MRIRNLPDAPGGDSQLNGPAAEAKKEIICYAIKTGTVDGRLQIVERSETGRFNSSVGLFEMPWNAIREALDNLVGLNSATSFNLTMNVGAGTVMLLNADGVALYELAEK